MEHAAERFPQLLVLVLERIGQGHQAGAAPAAPLGEEQRRRLAGGGHVDLNERPERDDRRAARIEQDRATGRQIAAGELAARALLAVDPDPGLGAVGVRHRQLVVGQEGDAVEEQGDDRQRRLEDLAHALVGAAACLVGAGAQAQELVERVGCGAGEKIDQLGNRMGVAQVREPGHQLAREREPRGVAQRAAAQPAEALAEGRVRAAELGADVRVSGEGGDAEQADGDPDHLPQRVAGLVGVAGCIEPGDGASQRLMGAGDGVVARALVEARQADRVGGDTAGGAEGGGELERVGVAVARVLGQGPREDVVERAREAGPERRHRLARVRHGDLHVGLAVERQAPGQRLEAEDAEGVEIGRRADRGRV